MKKYHIFFCLLVTIVIFLSIYRQLLLADGTLESRSTVIQSNENDFILNNAPCLPGDVNGNGSVGLEDAILALQLLSGQSIEAPLQSCADVNADGRLDLAEAIYILQSLTWLRAGSPLQFQKLEGDGVQATVNSSVQLTGAVIDSSSNPVSGMEVIFSILTGQANLSSSSAITDSSGRVTTTLTLRTIAGAVEVQVRGQAFDIATFTVTGLANRNNGRLIQVSGNRQVGEPGTILPEPLVVRLEDQFGNPVVGEEARAVITKGVGELLPIEQILAKPAPGSLNRAFQSETGSQLSLRTNSSGEAGFRLKIGETEETILVEVGTPQIPQVTPAQFIALIGFADPVAIAVEMDGNLVVIDVGLNAIIRVNPVTGVRSVISSNSIGNGPELSFFWGCASVAVEADGYLVITDDCTRVLRVNPKTGDRTVAPLFDFGGCSVVSVEPDGDLLVLQYAIGGLVLKIDRINGNQSVISGEERGVGPLWFLLSGIAVESNGRFVVVDDVPKKIIRVEPETGDRSIISDEFTGTGPEFGWLKAIAIESDGSLLVNDWLFAAIIRVNPINGNRSIVSGQEKGEGPKLRNPSGIAVERDGQLVVVDSGLRAVVRIDPANGNRSIISSLLIGTGPTFHGPGNIIVEEDGHLLVMDSSLRAILGVDQHTGSREIISGCTDPWNQGCNPVGDGPEFLGPKDMVLENNRNLIVLDLYLDNSLTSRVLRVDRVSGNRNILSGCTENCFAYLGNGPPFGMGRGVGLEMDGHLVVSDFILIKDSAVPGTYSYAGRVLRVDPVTGNRQIISGCEEFFGPTCTRLKGSGPSFGISGDLLIDSDGSIIVSNIVSNSRDYSWDYAVLRINSVTGDRSLVSGGSQSSSDNKGSGPVLANPGGLAREANGHLVVIDGSSANLIRIDPKTGDRTIVSDNDTVGIGIPFISPNSIAVESNGNLLVTDGGLGAILRINSFNGNRTYVSR